MACWSPQLKGEAKELNRTHPTVEAEEEAAEKESTNLVFVTVDFVLLGRPQIIDLGCRNKEALNVGVDFRGWF